MSGNKLGAADSVVSMGARDEGDMKQWGNPREQYQGSYKVSATEALGPSLPRLSADLALKVMAAAAGRPLCGPLTTDCYRAALPLALTCREYYRAFKGAVLEVDVLPIGFMARDGFDDPSSPSARMMLRLCCRWTDDYVPFDNQELLRRRLQKISDEDVSQLVSSLPNLTGLSMRAALSLTDKGAALLSQSPEKLRILKINGAHHLTDAAVRSLSQLSNLERLDLSFCSNLTLESAKFLRLFPSLKALGIATWNCADDSFVSTLFENGASSGIVELEMSTLPRLSNAGISMIAAALGTQLEVLKISHCQRISDAALDTIARQCPALREVDVSNCNLLTSNGVERLSALENLEVLRACFLWGVSDATIAKICERRKLKHIDVSFCPNVTDETALAVAECVGVSTVICHCVPKLTDAGVRALAKLPCLTRAKFSCCRKLTDNSLDALAGARNAPLAEIDVRGCKLLTVRRLRRMAMAKECTTLFHSAPEVTLATLLSLPQKRDRESSTDHIFEIIEKFP